MFYQTKDSKSAVITCTCGCDSGLVFKKDEETNDVYISMVENNFYFLQQTCLKRFVMKCKHIWRVLCNKEYIYFELIVEDKDIHSFKDFVNNL